MESDTQGNGPVQDGRDTLLTSARIQGALTLVLILLAAFLFAGTINSLKAYNYIGGGIAPSNAVTVSGEGEVFAVPDTAEFTFSIIEEASTVAEVQQNATDKANAAIEALKERGIEEKDIKTVAYELHPMYEWQPATCVRYPCDRKRVQTGFSLNQSIRVKVSDLDEAGEMLEIVTGKGVQSVSGLTFTIADEDSLKAEARKQAIDEAREKAEQLASDLDVSLVRIVGFSEDRTWPSPMYAARSMDEALDAGMGGAEPEASPAVPAGESRIVSNVHITYEIR